MTTTHTTLPDWWIETTLGEVCEIKWWKRLPKWENLVNYKTKHPYIRITDLENNKINKIQLLFVTDDVFSSISKYIVNSWDVILSIVWSIGFVAKIDKDLDNASLTENCVKFVNLRDLDSDFLYYFLISKLWQDEILKNTVWAVQKKLPIYWVQNISLLLPPLPEQQAIAKILSSFDDKIELLREQNETLEKMAQTIFEEWFGKYSVDDELPEGWRVGKLGEEFDITIWRTPPRLETEWFSNNQNDFKWISIKDIWNSWTYIFETSEFLTKEAVEKFNIPVIPENTTILSFKMTVWKLTITTEKMLSNEAIAHLKIKENSKISSEFIYTYLQKLDFNSLWSTSSIVTAINSTMIKNLEFIIPENSILEKFNESIKPIFEKIKINNEEIQTLSKTRDDLLPKLMKGEVRVV